MYELIFWDSGVDEHFGAMMICYVDDIWEFTQEWSKQIEDKDRIRKFLLALEGAPVQGNILTGTERQEVKEKDFLLEEYLDGVFLLEDPEAKILQQRIIELKDFCFRMEEAVAVSAEFKIKYMQVQIRYVRYDEEYLRLMSYYAQGIAKCETGTDGQKWFRSLSKINNSLVKREGMLCPAFSREFEDFTEETIELLAWYPMGYAETWEDLQEQYGKEKLQLTRQDLEQLFYDFRR